MAATILTPVSATEAGTAKVLAAATATQGDKFHNANDRGRVIFEVFNGSASPITVAVAVTVATTAVPGFGAVTKSAGGSSIAAGATEIIGPFDKCFEDANGYVTAICSAVTDVTICAIKLPRLINQ